MIRGRNRSGSSTKETASSHRESATGATNGAHEEEAPSPPDQQLREHRTSGAKKLRVSVLRWQRSKPDGPSSAAHEKAAALQQSIAAGAVDFHDLVILKHWQTLHDDADADRRAVGDLFYDKALGTWKEHNDGRIVIFPVAGVFLLNSGLFHYTILGSALRFDWSEADRLVYRIDSIAEQAREWWPGEWSNSTGGGPSQPPKSSPTWRRSHPRRAAKRKEREAAERQPHQDRAFAVMTGLFSAADLEHKRHEAAARPSALRRAFGLVTAAFAAIDPEIGPDGPASTSARPSETFGTKMAMLGQEVERAEFLLAVAAQRNAQTRYARGMVYGAGLLGIGCAIAGAIMALFSVPADYLIAVPAGAIGALVSVLQRMTSGSLSLDFHAGKQMLVFYGAVRPWIGAIFGMALFVFFEAGLFPAIADPEVPLGFYAAVGFLAGFNERFAQDMLVGSARRLTSQSAVSGSSRIVS